MTHGLAFIVLAAIVGALYADFTLFDRENSLFLARKFVDFIDWIAFWR